jgi:alcohol dehydrogenase
VLYLADILATGYEVGVLNGRVQPGDTVAVVGAGPIGLATIVGARLFSPAAIVAVDPAESRRDWASAFGATAVATPEEARGVVAGLTDGLGADVAVEAVGIPETFEQCTELIRPGGRVANVGVHGKAATLHLESLWIRDVTIATGLVDTFSTPTLLRAVATGQLAPTRFTTHRFPLEAAMDAYDTFARAGETNALKVLMTTQG